MGIIIDKNTRVLVQGITGKEGNRATKEMLDYGTKVSCGVTPGKGGMKVHSLKVFDSVKEAKKYDSLINTSVLYVPPLMVYDAALEAILNGIKTVVIITENVPVKDTTKLVEYAKRYNARIIGPASVGVLSVGVGKLGSIGGAEEKRMYSKGNVGIISKSGGMCAETALILTQENLGQSTIIGIGGDVIIGTTFTDILELFEEDKETEVVVLYGETGGLYEEQVADMIKKKEFTKPVIAFISGKFMETIDKSLSFGHAGAIIEHGIGKADDKKKILKEAGVLVADYHDQMPELVKKALKWNSRQE
ncbi:MAG: succinate--CoA ligase subunit alpha [Nanoarchaeota archaeon]|nr:succinate--CoA ligase subunit alpha [DPANN group archaeon]MBL7116272.1 succinate--CoA ligase subunit alpha [Nanoarchaeota archaeon]